MTRRGESDLCLHVLNASTFGGGEAMALNMFHAARKCDRLDARLLVPHGGSTIATITSNGLQTRAFDEKAVFSRNPIRSTYEAIKGLGPAGLYRRGLVHFHSPFMYGAFRHAVKSARLKRIVHIHLEYDAEALSWPLLRPPDAIIVCAHYLRQGVERVLAQSGRPRPPVYVLHNAIDISRFAAADSEEVRRSLQLPLGRIVLAVIANLAPHKGQLTAIHTLSCLLRRGLDAELLLVGGFRQEDAAYARQLHEAAAEANGRVRFLGHRSDIPEILRAVDYFLLPSLKEGLPLSILEAQASGAIVLASPTAGIPEIIEDRRTGFLIDASKPEMYAECIQYLSDRPAERKQIVRKAQKIAAARFDLAPFEDRLLKIYEEILRD